MLEVGNSGGGKRLSCKKLGEQEKWKMSILTFFEFLSLSRGLFIFVLGLLYFSGPLFSFFWKICEGRLGDKGSFQKLLSRFFLVRGGGVPKTLFFTLFHTILALFSLLYGLFGPFLTLCNTKTSFLDLLGKQISGKA